MRTWRALFPRASRATRRVVRCEEVLPAAAVGSGEPPAETAPAAPKEEVPVQFEMFNREWQSVATQDNFDGFRIEAANQVTKWLQAAHTLIMGCKHGEGYIYQFGPAFQTEDQRTMLVARVGIDGGVNGRWIQKLGNSFELKASSNSHLKQVERNMHEGSLEYVGDSVAWGGKLAWQGAWLLGGAYTQRITPHLQLGGDLTLVGIHGVTSIGQIGLRYAKDKDFFAAALSRTPDAKSPMGANLHEIRLHYLRRLSERLSLGSEFKLQTDKDSGLQFAYEYTFRQARIQGALDTDGKVSCCVFDFTGRGFSGVINYREGDYKFGVVMHIMPQPEGQQPM